MGSSLAGLLTVGQLFLKIVLKPLVVSCSPGFRFPLSLPLPPPLSPPLPVTLPPLLFAPGHLALQWPQRPVTWTPSPSTWVEHHGLLSGALRVMQLLCVTSANLNGKMQQALRTAPELT